MSKGNGRNDVDHCGEGRESIRQGRSVRVADQLDGRARRRGKGEDAVDRNQGTTSALRSTARIMRGRLVHACPTFMLATVAKSLPA